MASLASDQVESLLRQCVTVVKPGETLVIRAPGTWTPDQVEMYQEYVNSFGLPFRVLVVLGDELAIAEPVPSFAKSPKS